MEAEPILSSSQESVGVLFESNLPANCYGLISECSLDQLDAADYELAAAERQARESGSITPLVKQELKLLIQTRRLSQGKDEMRVGFAQPPSHQLTPAERDRRIRRKDQNRRAAKRFRQNKKLRESVLVEEITMLEGKNDGLREKVTELNRLKAELLARLTAHMALGCPTFPLPTCPTCPTLSPPPYPASMATPSSAPFCSGPTPLPTPVQQCLVIP